MKIKKIVVLGAGAWGTALALSLNRNGHEVFLLPKFETESLNLEKYRENIDWLKGVKIPDEIHIGYSYDELMKNKTTFDLCDYIFWAIPAIYSVEAANKLSKVIRAITPIVICSKGLVHDEGEKMGPLMSNVLGSITQSPIAVLSGPNFAKEVANNQQTAVVVSAMEKSLSIEIAKLIKNSNFRAFVEEDIISVQIAGAMKNVFAIACGIAIGMNLGQNAISEIISLGIAECSRICVNYGGKIETLLGLSGIGDFALTCLSKDSRNTSFGIKLGQGESVKSLVGGESKQIVEGYHTARTAYLFARKLDVQTPLLDAVYNILYCDSSACVTLEKVLIPPEFIEFENFS